MFTTADLMRSPNPLAAHYSRFRVEDRILLTGHSHQAWPDVAFEGQVRAFEDAAEFVDDKWERAFAMADRVRRGFAERLGDSTGLYSLDSNTHNLIVRLLSALLVRGRRRRVVTTDGEFHSIRRQVDRLAEEGVSVVRIHTEPVDTLAERVAAAVNDRTAIAMLSAVLFRNARIVPNLAAAAQACRRAGCPLLVDTYHALNVVPFSIAEHDLDDAFIVGGGYKYMQLGEGNCFLRFPRDTELRPVVTGWFAEFDALEAAPRPGEVAFGRSHQRFAGATYDPVSHYRAAAVLDFFDEHGLTPALLREVSQRQIGFLAEAFDRLDLDPTLIARDRDVPIEKIGGFLALRSPHAGEISQRLRERGIATDHRGDSLRLGPAPYLSLRQLEDAIETLAEAATASTGTQPS